MSNYVFEISNERTAYLGLRKQYVDYSLKIEEKFRNSFNQLFGDFEKLGEYGISQTLKLIDGALQNAISIMVNNGLMTIDEKTFFDDYYAKYFADYCDVYEKVMDSYYEIILDEEELEEYRSKRKQNRARWIGGGFGVGGALKGAATAGALNIATGAAMGIVNLGLNFIDKKLMKREVEKLYNNKKAVLEPLANEVKKVVYMMHLAIVDCLEANNIKTMSCISDDDKKNCLAIVNNLSRINDEEERKKYIIEAFQYDQTNFNVLEMIDQLFNENKNEIGDIIKTCYLEDDFCEKYEKKYSSDLHHDVNLAQKYEDDISRYKFVSEKEQKWDNIQGELNAVAKEYKIKKMPFVREIKKALDVFAKEKLKYMKVYFSDYDEMKKNADEYNEISNEIKLHTKTWYHPIMEEERTSYTFSYEEWCDLKKRLDNSNIPQNWKKPFLSLCVEHIESHKKAIKTYEDALKLPMPVVDNGVISVSGQLSEKIYVLSNYLNNGSNVEEISNVINETLTAYWDNIEKIDKDGLIRLKSVVEKIMPVLKQTELEYDNLLSILDKKIEEKQQFVYNKVKKLYGYMEHWFKTQDFEEYNFKLIPKNDLQEKEQGGVILISEDLLSMSNGYQICEKGVFLRKNYHDNYYFSYSEIKKFEVSGKRILVVTNDDSVYRLTDDKFKKYPDEAAYIAVMLNDILHMQKKKEKELENSFNESNSEEEFPESSCENIENMNNEQLRNLEVILRKFPEEKTKPYYERIAIRDEKLKKNAVQELESLCEGFEKMSCRELKILKKKIKNYDDAYNSEYLKKVTEQYNIMQMEEIKEEIKNIVSNIGEMSKDELINAKETLSKYPKDLRKDALNSVDNELNRIDKEEKKRERDVWNEKTEQLENMALDTVQNLLGELKNSEIHQCIKDEFLIKLEKRINTIHEKELNMICINLEDSSFEEGLSMFQKLKEYDTPLELKNSLIEKVSSHLVDINMQKTNEMLKIIDEKMASKGVNNDVFGTINGIAVKTKYYSILNRYNNDINSWDIPLVIHIVEKALSSTEMYVLYMDCFVIITSKGCTKYPISSISEFYAVKKLMSSMMAIRCQNGSIVEIKNNHGNYLDSCVSILNDCLSMLKKNNINTTKEDINNHDKVSSSEILEKTKSLFGKLKKERVQNVIYFVRENDAKFDKRILGATKTYANLDNDENILAICDTTLLGSGKEGFVITTKSMYLSGTKGGDKIQLSDIDCFVTEYNINDKYYYVYAMLKSGNKQVIPGKFLNAETLAVNSINWLNGILEVIK